MKTLGRAAIIFFVIFTTIFTQGCVFKLEKNNNQTIQNKNTNVDNVDYVKKIKQEQNTDNECLIYQDRVNGEIEEYKKRINRDNIDTQENFELIGIFKSKTLNKCFYVLKDSYINNGNNIIDYIINNAEKEETIDIFNNIDYKILNERIKELQK